MRDCSRFKGCLLGGAVGDALGYAVEFMSKSEIVCAYGPQGITRYEPRAGKAQISDDTQMTLFTAGDRAFSGGYGAAGRFPQPRRGLGRGGDAGYRGVLCAEVSPRSRTPARISTGELSAKTPPGSS